MKKPKFKIGDKVWYVCDGKFYQATIISSDLVNQGIGNITEIKKLVKSLSGEVIEEIFQSFLEIAKEEINKL